MHEQTVANTENPRDSESENLEDTQYPSFAGETAPANPEQGQENTVETLRQENTRLRRELSKLRDTALRAVTVLITSGGITAAAIAAAFQMNKGAMKDQQIKGGNEASVTDLDLMNIKDLISKEKP